MVPTDRSNAYNILNKAYLSKGANRHLVQEKYRKTSNIMLKINIIWDET